MLESPLLLHIEASWSSPWACTCYVALREKGLPFATSVAMLNEERALISTYRELSLTGRVPALQHGDFWLPESSAVVEYLEERFPPPDYPYLLPADIHERARARMVMAWLRSDLWALREEWDASMIFYAAARAPRPLSRSGERDVAKLVEVAERLVPRGRTQMFAEWSIADLDLAFALRRLVVNGRPLAPHLAAFTEAQWQRRSVREFAEHPRTPHPWT